MTLNFCYNRKEIRVKEWIKCFFGRKKSKPQETTESVSIDRENIPQHIAVIMDGNGRWAKKRNLPRIAGHKEGMSTENVSQLLPMN